MATRDRTTQTQSIGDIKDPGDRDLVVRDGDLVLLTEQGEMVRVSALGNLRLGGPAGSGRIHLQPEDGTTSSIYLDGKGGNLWLGGNGVDGDVVLFPQHNKTTGDGTQGTPTTFGKGSEKDAAIHLNGNGPRVLVRGGDITIKGHSDHLKVTMRDSQGGMVTVHNSLGAQTIRLNGQEATLTVGGGGDAGHIQLKNRAGKQTLHLNGEAGDIVLANGDCAEDFDVVPEADVTPGSVLVIEEDGRLNLCRQPYDRRVAGVVAGAGDCRPGILLGRKAPDEPGRRLPIALTGRVYCRVDASFGAVEVGDLLTTSPTSGHAMRVSRPENALGSVLGKALAPLDEGSELLPILVSLQ